MQRRLSQMTLEEKYKGTLAKYLPASAVDSIFGYLNSNRVFLHITRRRSSKLGDYRFRKESGSPSGHEISVNGDLPPYMFLLVLLHEMAHLEVHLQYGRTVQPHGHQWQQIYRTLLRNYSDAGHFPQEARPLIEKYTAAIPLNRAIGRRLENLLTDFGRDGSAAATRTRLCDLPEGSLFRLKEHPSILFRSLEKRRTRYRCMDENSKKEYLVSGNAEVVSEEDV